MSDRLIEVVEHLDVQPRDRILEIGCGRGVAAELVCSRYSKELLDGGRLLGIDRSAKAIEAALVRNAEAVAQGRASFETVGLAGYRAEVVEGVHSVIFRAVRGA